MWSVSLERDALKARIAALEADAAERERCYRAAQENNDILEAENRRLNYIIDKLGYISQEDAEKLLTDATPEGMSEVEVERIVSYVKSMDKLGYISHLEAKNARLREALEFCAEEQDRGRHDGKPEPGPAHDDVTMWAVARAALAPKEPKT